MLSASAEPNAASGSRFVSVFELGLVSIVPTLMFGFDSADYLTPHGARRGIGEEVYRLDREQAQDLLRHQDLSTTKDHYQHIDAAERTDDLDEILFEDGGE